MDNSDMSRQSTVYDNKNVRYIGRFDFSEKIGPKFAWVLSTITARFYGTGVSAYLKSFGDNYFTVTIDGKVYIRSLYVNRDGIYELVSDLPEGVHEVSLIKRTEPQVGMAQFLGFDFHGGRVLEVPQPRKRRLEIIGDSISNGYGNEAENANVPYDPKDMNAYLAYESIAARNLNADCTVTAWSGVGLVRNYDGSEGAMPRRYLKILPEISEEEWNFKEYIPQVVAINLGTNDFSNGFIPDKDRFTSAYIKLINKIHGNYPSAKVICSIGPIMSGEALNIIRDYVKENTVEPLRSMGNDWVYFLEYEEQKAENGYGQASHPSLKTHELMAEQLTQMIKDIMGW
jgi:Lysophospholipase L1 and related esterases